MKTYTITVNGKAYAVTVEEGAAAAGAPVAAPVAAQLRQQHLHRQQLQQAQQVPFRLPLQCQVR